MQYDDQSKSLSLLYTFQNNGTDGINPTKLMQNDDGDVFGITQSGGVFQCTDPDTAAYIGCGTIFSISNGVYAQLHQFGASGDGQYPISLVEGSFESDNIIYGVTEFGGVNNCGTIFSIDIHGNYSKLYDFSCGNGTPNGALVNPDDGYLYGTTSNSSSLYRFDPSTNTFTILYNFPSINIIGNLENINGIFYGLSNTGGANNSGFIYSISTDGSNFKDVYDFGKLATTDVGYPTMITSDGYDNIYGYARQFAGSNNYGVIFKYTLSTNSFQILYNSNYNLYETNSLKYDFSNNSLLSTIYSSSINLFISPLTSINFNNILQSSDPKYGIGSNDVIALN